MGNKLGVSNPVSAGQVFAAYNASSVSDTDWHTLTSNEFYDAATQTQLADGLQFAFVAMVSSSSTNLSYLKLRAASGAGDGKTNADGVIPVFGRFTVDSQALQAFVTSIAYAKGAAGDDVVIYTGFNK